MISMTVGQIKDAVGGILLMGDMDSTIGGVSIDSRTLFKGDLFIPIIGERFDGHDFISQAVDKGAAAIVTSKKDINISGEAAVILVEDTLKALKDIAQYYRSLFQIPFIAVTGSNGKTTTKDMIYTVLSKKYKVLKTKGNFNNEIGLPLTILNLDNSYDMAVIEMGMSGFGEIHSLTTIVRPKVAVITNIGVSHIEKLGSRQNILKAKMEIFDSFHEDCMAILNGDDQLLKDIHDKLPYNICYMGANEEVDIKAQNIKVMGEEGVSYKVSMDNAIYDIRLRVPGAHNIYNSLIAIAVGRYFGVDMVDIQNALENFEMGDMRLNIFTTNGGIKVIDDVYNASPDSMKAALAILKDFEGKRKIAVLGDMLEMGEYTEKGHRQVGKVVSDYNIDILITKGQASIFIGEEAKKAGMIEENIYNCNRNKDVINLLSTMINSGDTILVKGSRGMHMEEIVSYLQKGRQE